MAAVPEFYAGKPARKFRVVRAPGTESISNEDFALVGKIRQLYNDARSHRMPMVQKWIENYILLRNRTRPENWPTYQSFPEVPEIWPIRESIVGWLCDQRPTFDVAPVADLHSTFYDFLQSVADDLRIALQANWQINDHEAEIECIARDALTFGAGIAKTHWDAALVDGLGDALIRRVDPFAFYPDPGAHDETDGNYYIEARRMSLQELDRRFPGAMKLFESGTVDDDIDQKPDPDRGYGKAPMATPGPISPNTNPTYGLPGQSRRSVYDREGVTVLECWLREHEASKDDNPTIKDGWRCVVIAGPHVLLNCPATDIWSHGMHPYDRYVLEEEGEFWGTSMVELLAPAQRNINRLLSALQHNAELTGNPVLIEDSRAQIGRTKLVNKPGQRVTKNAGSSVEWLQAPNMSSDTRELITWYLNEMERVSGLSAINRGISPGGRNAASVIDSMQEASFVRVRMASRNLERTLRGCGNKVASLIAEYYDEPRMVAFLGPDGARTTRIIKAKHFYVPSGKEKDPAMPLRFSLMVDAGSTLATSRQSRIAEADTLFAMGALDLMSLLEAHDYPNRHVVYQRVQAERGAGIQPPGSRQRTQRTS